MIGVAHRQPEAFRHRKLSNTERCLATLVPRMDPRGRCSERTSGRWIAAKPRFDETCAAITRAFVVRNLDPGWPVGLQGRHPAPRGAMTRTTSR
jgi:hypothetical protein